MSSPIRIFSPPACQPVLARAQRKATGVYYTPPEIVRLIFDLALDKSSASQPPRILDPACGAGEFLVEAYARLRSTCGAKAAQRSIFALDIDSAAVAAAQSRLRDIDEDFPAKNIRTADALDLASVPPASFDLIVGNPPYVNIRQLAKNLSGDEIDALRQRFRTARGNFDLYVLFIERAIDLLCPGGRCALIIPNKWATLEYARSCRELLLAQSTIQHVIDLSSARPFADASVYPNILVFKKEAARPAHAVRFREFGQSKPQSALQRNLSPAAIHLARSIDLESRVPTLPLDEVAVLSCGTAGYRAHKIAIRLLDRSAAAVNAASDFITSGNIDRYAIRIGNVRYLSRDYIRPRLPLNIPELTAAKRRLFTEPKIVIAGMSRRLEAAWDDQRLALGVQVFAASQFKVDPLFLLALLNSKLLSFLFATRFAAKRLGGGYLAINKAQLARLPIAVPQDRAARQTQLRLGKLAAHWMPALDRQIDRLVYQLYRLSTAEIARVEDHIAAKAAAA